MSIIILIIILLLGVFETPAVEDPDCVDGGDGCLAPVAATGWLPVEVNGIDGVIVSADDAPLFGVTGASWTPSTADLEAAEAAIAAAHGELEHMRQYVGYEEGGERKMLINGFCDAFGLEWRSEPILVADGGECFFQAVYNVDTDELESFSFNGEA